MPVNKKFFQKLDQQIKERNKMDFFIVVWGSGESNEIAFKKRKQMVEVLSKEFKKENVIMSEDKDLESYNKKFGVLVSESIQADAADFVIILATSVSPLLEASLYFQKIRHKCIVIFRDEDAKNNSFPSYLTNMYNLCFFKDENFQKCELVQAGTGKDIYDLCLKKAQWLKEEKFNRIHNCF